MPGRDQELRKRLLATFKGEAREHISALSDNLLQLERTPLGETAKIIETAFREAHSLKGAARAVSLDDMERVCQAMESVFASLKRGVLAPSPELIDLLLRAVRVLEKLQALLEEDAPADAAKPPLNPLIAELAKAAHPSETPSSPASPAGSPAPTTPTPPPAAALKRSAAEFPGLGFRLIPRPPQDDQPATAESPAAAPAESPQKIPRFASAASEPGRSGALTVRIAAEKLDAARLQAEELLADKLAAAQLAADLRGLRLLAAEWRKRWGKARAGWRAACAQEVAASKLANPAARPSQTPARAASAKPMEFFEEFASFADSLEHRVAILAQAAKRGERSLAAKVDSLIEDTRELLMLPCSWLLDGLRRAVRDLARDLGKEIELAVEGEAIEIDRRILMEIKDPLIHALRNSVDHGIEAPAERERAGKPRRGLLRIAISRTRGGRLEVLVADDGRGIDVEKVKAAALKLGVIDAPRASKLDRQGMLNLIFQSEVSTSPIITDLSGRGLGLAIVREKAEKLGGGVAVESLPGAGTTLRLLLPLSLATFRGVIVRAGERFFVAPTANVERAIRVAKEDIRAIENREVVPVGGEAVSLARLADALGLPPSAAVAPEAAGAKQPALVVSSGLAGRAVFLVDEVCQEQEVLVKSLGPMLEGLPGVSGAAVLGSGKVAPILEAGELIRAAARRGDSGARRGASRTEARRKSILVAEDSITSRALLKSILESAGYSVETAVDGVDALDKLRAGEFDLAVSDVDMPRLNGLGLTAKIRSDKKLAELPVILVTSLDSREDRERGADVGASAYIVKRGFEQSNLLEVVRRLL